MLPFLCLPLVFIPGRWFFSVVILGIISIMQMFIPVSTRVLVPDDFIHKMDQVGYFAYSTIYNYCLPRLMHGNLSRNLGIYLFRLNHWLSLVLPLAVLFIFTWFFLVRSDYSKR
jgi:hypothetical protein